MGLEGDIFKSAFTRYIPKNMLVRKSEARRSYDIPENVLLSWGERLTVDGQLGQSVWLARQGVQSLVLKKRSSSFNLELEHSLLRTLSERGTPVAIAVPIPGGQQAYSFEGNHWSLYPRIPGHSVSLATVTSSEAHALGAILGDTHAALDHFGGGRQLPELTFSGELGKCPRGLIHRDFHASNILFEAGRISAVLDFDLVCNGPRIFDLAYLGASLLADAWQQSVSRERFLPTLAEIVRGYHSRRPLEPDEVRAIPLFLEEVENIFVELGRAIGNKQMENGAAEVMAWFVQHRTATAQAVKGISQS